MNATETLRKTPLHALHIELGAKMVPFAGYDMPVQYPTGVLKEHLHTRSAAGLFDVSHMGQRFLTGPDHASVARTLETLTPGDFQNLGMGRMRYTMLLSKDGGIIDDLMVARLPFPNGQGAFGIVFNAGRKEIDDAHVRGVLPANVKLTTADDFALLALQGPAAEKVMARHCPEAAAMSFMSTANAKFDGIGIGISRSGYTGEDGYEISVKAADACALHARCWKSRMSCPSGWARGTHCGSKPAFACMATTSMKPPRPSKPIWPGPSASVAGKKKTFRVRRAS